MKLFKKEKSNKYSIFPENSIFGKKYFSYVETEDYVEIKLLFMHNLVSCYGMINNRTYINQYYINDIFFKFNIILKKRRFFFFKEVVAKIKNNKEENIKHNENFSTLYLYISKKDFAKYKLLSG